MQYNLEYHKALDRSHILPNVTKGAYTGIASQFISDIILSFLLLNDQILIEDIQISHISHYFASVLTGMLANVSAGISVAIVLSVVTALIFKPKD